jgi:hypothetical protein
MRERWGRWPLEKTSQWVSFWLNGSRWGESRSLWESTKEPWKLRKSVRRDAYLMAFTALDGVILEDLGKVANSPVKFGPGVGISPTSARTTQAKKHVGRAF